MLKTMGVAATLAFILGGCMSVKPGASAGSDRACLADTVKFSDAWACVRARLVAKSDSASHPDGLIEEGDLLEGQVRAGKVSEADARKRLTSGLAHDAS